MDRIDFEVVTAKGVTVHTFDTRRRAVEWVRDNPERGDLQVFEVIHQAPIRRRIRTHLRIVA